jgi:hypothetical protein
MDAAFTSMLVAVNEPGRLQLIQAAADRHRRVSKCGGKPSKPELLVVVKEHVDQHGLRRRPKLRPLNLTLSIVFPEVDTQWGQVHLVARHDERHALLDESFAVVGGDRPSDEGDGAAPSPMNLVDVLSHRCGRHIVVVPVQHQQAGRAEQLDLMEVVSILQKPWQVILTAPRSGFDCQSGSMAQIVRDVAEHVMHDDNLLSAL